MYISTHTLTWSVTGVPQTWGGDYHNFNSHAHVERDGNAEKIKLFEKNFNSHAHVERDALSSVLTVFTVISTHTLTWSVTKTPYGGSLSLAFQLTRSRGA